MAFPNPEPITLHDPTRWTMLFDTFSVQGFGDGDALSIEPPTETVKAKRGVMGEYALALVTDALHSLKVNLHQTSATNAAFRGFFRAQFRPGAIVPRVCSLRNTITGETWRGVAWLTSDAPMKVGAEVQNIEWDFGFHVDPNGGYTPPA